MAEVTLNTIFQFKRGTAEAWARNNPILRAAEPGYELDTGKLKIGDGTSPWNILEYLNDTYSLSVDGKSLILNQKNEVQILGYEDALHGQMLVKDDEKGLTWVNPLSENTLNQAVASAEQAAATANNYATQAGNQAISADISAKNAARALEIIQHDIFWFGTIQEYNELESITEDKIYVILT